MTNPDSDPHFSLPTYKLSGEEIFLPQVPLLLGALVEGNLGVTLQVGEDTIVLMLMPDHLVILGRDKSFQPLADIKMIDLTKYNALQRGVSRQHVSLHQKESLVFITDLKSTNGTWLNGKLLPPHQRRVIRDGDEVQLGNLPIKVFFPQLTSKEI